MICFVFLCFRLYLREFFFPFRELAVGMETALLFGEPPKYPDNDTMLVYFHAFLKSVKYR